MSSGTNTERITQNNGIITGNNADLEALKTRIQNLPTRAVTQTKSVTITENGTTTVEPDTGYDGLSSIEVTTNVSGGIKVVDGMRLGLSTQLPNNLDTSEITTMTNFFRSSTFNTIPSIDTRNVTLMNYMFSQCNNLKSIPLIDTKDVTSMYGMFYQCSALTTIPQLDTSSVTDFGLMFMQCGNLTNESLNNILAMCINATSYTGTKTIRWLGLTQEQATTCQTLSNWNDFVSAGWSSGY